MFLQNKKKGEGQQSKCQTTGRNFINCSPLKPGTIAWALKVLILKVT